MSRLARAWAAFRAPEPKTEYYVVEDMSPVGYRILFRARTWDRAEDYRFVKGTGRNWLIFEKADWERQVVALMASLPFWQHWGRIAQRARMWDDHLAQERADVFAAGADRDPWRETIPEHMRPAEPLDTAALSLHEVASRARGRHTPPVGLPVRDVPSQSLPEGVTWDDEA